MRAFDGLAVQFVREAGAMVMLRGLRTLSDMEYEFTMSLMNLNLDPEIETVFLMAKERVLALSAVRCCGRSRVFGGDLRSSCRRRSRVAVRRRARCARRGRR